MILEENICREFKARYIHVQLSTHVSETQMSEQRKLSGAGSRTWLWCSCSDGTCVEKTAVRSHLFLKLSANKGNLLLWVRGVKSRSYSKHQQQTLALLNASGMGRFKPINWTCQCCFESKRQCLWFIWCIFVACVCWSVSLSVLRVEIEDFEVIARWYFHLIKPFLPIIEFHKPCFHKTSEEMWQCSKTI